MEDQEELDQIESTIRDFVLKEVLPVGYARETSGEFPHDILQKLYAIGFGGMSIPEQYGGGSASTVATSIVAQWLAYGWPSLHLVWSANNSLAGFPLIEFANEEQKLLYLPPLARREIYGCYGLTEPNAGSDAASLGTKAEMKKGMWVLNGTKMFITNASQATLAIIFARVASPKTKQQKRHEGITAFILRAHGPGLEYPGVSVREISKQGFKCAPFCEVYLKDVQIPVQNVLGEVGKGASIAMHTLNNGRINIAAQSVGIARRALREAAIYANMREQFGRQLLANQAVAHKLADLETAIDAAWELTLKAAREKDKGNDYRTWASKAKLFASQTAKETAEYMQELHGAMGYTKEMPTMRIANDARVTVIYEGASNIQRGLIARGLVSRNL